MRSNKIRLLLVDDHQIARSGVKLLLESESDIEIAGEAENAKETLRIIHEQEIDIVLMDISMQDKSGLDLLQTVRAQKPELRVLMLSMHDEEVYAVRALKLGASGYLSKKIDRTTLIEAIRKVAAGRRYISPAIADKLVNMVSGETLTPAEMLTNRELEILRLIAAGVSLNKIAEKLHISASTVTTYRRRILDKTGVSSNAELANYARETKILH
jgi:DNA-binding NarL/FixJ family response regulator